MQREQGCPNGSPEIQFDFALRIHRRLRQAAPEVIFSSVRREGERALRESPLLTLDADVLTREILSPPPPSLIAQLQTTRHQPLVALDDAQAPPVGPDEALRGGTGALKAQAICPAWSFYQYRLGARALEVPVEGLDARGRGSAVHAVLEQFWRGRSLSEVRAWDGDRLAMEIDRAVVAGLAQFEEEAGEPLPAAFRALEAARLAKLLGRWVALELTRPVDFVVVACETEHVIDIDGLRAKVVVDRIDQLDDGRLFILDYKTGKKVDASSWPSARIAEPQLPIYASLLDHHDPVAGIAFAQVLLDEPRFTGIAESPALLPKVLGLDEAWKKGWDEAEFPDWGSVRAHWTAALRALVAEIRSGGAATVFSRVEELKYCDVAPVLRLAERHQQYSEALAAALNAPSNEASA